MPNPEKIIDEIENSLRLLSSMNTEYLQLTKDRAACEMAHSIASGQALTKLEIEGAKSTGIAIKVKGDKLVARLKYDLDIAEGVMKARKQSMQNEVTKIDGKRSVLTWLREEKKG